MGIFFVTAWIIVVVFYKFLGIIWSFISQSRSILHEIVRMKSEDEPSSEVFDSYKAHAVLYIYYLISDTPLALDRLSVERTAAERNTNLFADSMKHYLFPHPFNCRKIC